MPKDIVFKRPRGKDLTAAELTKIERAGLPEGVERMTVKDAGGVKGLELRLTRAGGRSWALSKRFEGRQRRWTLEGAQTLEEARSAARILIGKLEQKIDPKAKPEPAPETAATMTLGDLLDVYLATERGSDEQRSLPARVAHMKSKLAAWLDRPASSIKAQEVIALLDAAKRAGRGRVSAFRAISYLRPVMGWARSRSDTTGVKLNPVAEIDPEEMKKLRKAMNHKKGDHTLGPDEIRALWRACESQPECQYGRLLRFALVTGQRRSEVGSLRWEDVDLSRAIWRQSANKSNRPHDVPLTTLALELMGEPKSAGLVFPSRGGSSVGGAAGNWSRAITKYKVLSGVKGKWSAHDLRRTFATILSSLSVSFTVRELLLNHSERTAKGGELGKTYDKHDYVAERREAMERLSRHIRGLLDGPGSSTVVELRRVAAS